MTRIDNFALIIGAMKCGTTSLFSYLSQHPQVSTCSAKEPDFFACDDNWANGFNWYQGLWNWDPLNHTIALEASTNYTKAPAFPNVPERIARIQADFRFIYLLRNPIDRIESHYRYGRLMGFIAGSLQEVLPYLIEVSRYARQLDEYSKRFPVESILLLDFEDLKGHPLELVWKVCDFLEIDRSHSFSGIGEIHNPSGRGSISHPIWDRASRVRPLRSFAKLLPIEQRNAIRRFFARKDRVRPTLSEEQRAFALRQLEDDLHRLQTEYGFDVSKWNIPGTMTVEMGGERLTWPR